MKVGTLGSSGERVAEVTAIGRTPPVLTYFIVVSSRSNIAVTSATRSPLLPNVPTFIESGLPNYEVSAWFGIFAPANAPAEAVAKLNAEFRKAVRAPDVAQRLESLGADPMGSSAADFSKFVQSEYDKWSRVIKAAGISSEK